MLKYNKTKRDKFKILLNLLPTDCGLKPGGRGSVFQLKMLLVSRDAFTGLSFPLFSRASLARTVLLATEGMKAHLDLRSVPWNTCLHALELKPRTGPTRSK